MTALPAPAPRTPGKAERHGRTRSPIASPNERALLDLVRRHGALSRADLARTTGLTAQSVMRLVDELAGRGLLRLGDVLPRPGRGKPSPGVELVSGYAYTMGVSITTDSVTSVLADFSGTVLGQRRAVTPRPSRAQLVAVLRQHLQALLRRHRVPGERLFGIGVGITGFFVGEGRLVNPPEPLDELALVDLEALFADALGHAVWLDNDGSVAAVGESLRGVGRWAPSFAYLYFGHGLGGGLIVDGGCVRGAHGNAGEVAGMLPALGMERPTLEQLRELLATDGIAFANIHDMLEHFDPGWPACERWIDAAVPALSLIVSAIVALVDPDAIVFGGRLPRALCERLIARLQIDNLPRRGRKRPQPRLVPAESLDDATAIGAALLPLKEWFFR